MQGGNGLVPYLKLSFFNAKLSTRQSHFRCHFFANDIYSCGQGASMHSSDLIMSARLFAINQDFYFCTL